LQKSGILLVLIDLLLTQSFLVGILGSRLSQWFVSNEIYLQYRCSYIKWH